MKPTKKKLSWFACRIHDEDLANRCDKISDLSQAERKRVDAALVEYVSNGHLGKASRDNLICMAKARSILAATEMKPKPRNANAVLNANDPYSSSATGRGYAYAVAHLSRHLRSPTGAMLTPPTDNGRRDA